MRLAKKTQYALLALAELASREGDAAVEPLQARELGHRQGIPVKFLEQILATLKSSGLVQSRRGCNGGYVLGRPARAISLGEVVRLFEGSMAPFDSDEGQQPAVPGDEHCPCRDPATCGVRDIMGEVELTMTKLLDSLTLEDVRRRSHFLRVRQSAALLYSI